MNDFNKLYEELMGTSTEEMIELYENEFFIAGMDREEAKYLVKCMRDADFFTASCSGGHHLCVEGGLAVHSMMVFECAVRIADALCYDDKLAVAQASLLHDLGKATSYGQPHYVKKGSLKSGKLPKQPYEVNKNKFGIPHATLSLIMAQDMLDITEEVAFAIAHHNGLYSNEGREVKGKETELYLILHTADMYSSRFLEEVGVSES